MSNTKYEQINQSFDAAQNNIKSNNEYNHIFF